MVHAKQAGKQNNSLIFRKYYLSMDFFRWKMPKGISIIIALFIVSNLIFLNFYSDVWWDSAVYIGMGRYIYSFGNSGLWESSRPIVWPLMLGFLWKIGLNVVLVGRILEIVFGSLCILLTYVIGRKLFNEKIAILSSIFLALSPTFFFFNGIMLTEVVSTFFSLVAIYFFIDKKYFISGLFLGISFMTRYLQLFVFVSMILVNLSHFNKKNIKKIVIGFAIAILPFLILNQILYNNVSYPFIQQIALSKNSGWLNYHPLSYYLIELFKENFLYLLSIFGILLIFKRKNTNKIAISMTFILFFIFFNSIKQKEMRLLIILMPYMYLLASYSIFHFFHHFKSKIAKIVLIAAVLLSLTASLMTTFIYYNNESNKINQYAVFQDRLEKISSSAKIWISNPIMAAFSDNKIDNIIYYPFFDEEKKKELLKEIQKADFIFLDSCDLACKPSDVLCENSKDELIKSFKQQLKIIYSFKTNQCNQVIFQK